MKSRGLLCRETAGLVTVQFCLSVHLACSIRWAERECFDMKKKNFIRAGQRLKFLIVINLTIQII